MPSRRRCMSATLTLLLLALVALPATSARADVATFTVNSAADPATGTASNCAPTNAGTCTLRDAVAAANATTGATVAFAPLLSTITLASPLTVSSAMTIQGNGTLLTSVIASSASNDVFDVTASDPVTFTGMSIASGKDGITIRGAGGVTVTACSLFFNTAAGVDNTVTGTLTVTNSSLSGNGRGLVNTGGGTAHIADSAVVQNATTSTLGGGGILNGPGTLTVTNTTVAQNSSPTGGGGIADKDGPLTVTDSTFSGNSADAGGGIYIDDSTRVTASITNSTFIGNTAGGGGGIFIAELTTLTVVNSTLAGNSASHTGGGIGAYPNDNEIMTLINSTVAGNGAPSLGGNISNRPGSETYATNTLIVDSISGGDLEKPLDGDSHTITGAFTFADPDPTQPKDHGGPTKTLALPAGSPAIGAGDPATCASSSGAGGVDQRGIPRPATVCDIGAYETPGKTFIVADLTGAGTDGTTPVTVIATDGFGNIMTGYRGVVRISSTDPASTPITYQFTAADAGKHPFPSLFITAGNQTVTATDTALTGTGTMQVPLVVGSLNPTSGDVHGGGTATITGANFGTDPAMVSVTFAGAAATVTQATGTSITVRVPPHPAGTLDVMVTVNGTSVTKAGAYTYGTTNALPSPVPTSGAGGTPRQIPQPRPATTGGTGSTGGTGGATPSPLPGARP